MNQPESDVPEGNGCGRRGFFASLGVAAAAVTTLGALSRGSVEAAPQEKLGTAADEPTDKVVLINGKPRHVRLQVPRRKLRDAAIVICLAGDRSASFIPDGGHNIVAETMLGCGNVVLSFDLPNHGELADKYGSDLAGIVASVAAGRDVFAELRETGKAIIDWALQQGWSRTGTVLLHGTSRGGLAALHVMAGDPRVAACAIHAPVTHIPAVREFAALANNPIIQRANAEALIDKLAGRPVFLGMGESDPRVSSERAFTFMARLSARSRGEDRNEIFCGPGASHGATFDWEPAYEAAAAFLLRCHAQRTRTASTKDRPT